MIISDVDSNQFLEQYDKYSIVFHIIFQIAINPYAKEKMKYTILCIVELAISLEEESTFDFLYNEINSVAGALDCML